MSNSFEIYKKIMEETVETQNRKIEMLQKENDNLRQQIYQLQMQIVNFMGNRLGNGNIENNALK
jgi:cell division protein FtsB